MRVHERERKTFRKEAVQHANFAETESCSIFLSARKILGQDLIIICLIITLSFNLLFSKRFPHHDSVCLSCLPPPKKKWYMLRQGARGGEWLRHYATDRLVAGSIPDGVIGIFQ